MITKNHTSQCATFSANTNRYHHAIRGGVWHRQHQSLKRLSLWLRLRYQMDRTRATPNFLFTSSATTRRLFLYRYIINPSFDNWNTLAL